ncbi:MAG: hypothetical protein KIT27_10225 [Legionellales bacterium]|nr:hypothetical protein [Legionellales bacterium]
MKSNIYSLLIDFSILAVVSILLLATENTLFRQNVVLYDLAWAIVVLVAILTIFLRPRKRMKHSDFPKDLAKTIENSLPHDAIKLFKDWYLEKLINYYSFIKNKSGIGLANDSSKKMAMDISKAFERIGNEPLYQVLEDRNKDNAIVSIIFFTVLLRSLSGFANKSIFDKPVSQYRDTFNIINLNDANRHLFREHYRLYEIGTILSNNFSALNFNSDIEDILCFALKNQPTTTDRVVDNLPAESLDILSEKPNINPSKTSTHPEAITSISDLNRGNEITDSTPDEIEIKKDVDTSIEHCTDDKSNCEKFIKWLQRQLKRNPANESFYFFYKRSFGNSNLFVSETAFVDFSKKSNIKVNDIKHSLVEMGIAKNNIFKFSKEGQPSIPLTIVQVDFNFECLTELDGDIEEGEV